MSCLMHLNNHILDKENSWAEIWNSWMEVEFWLTWSIKSLFFENQTEKEENNNESGLDRKRRIKKIMNEGSYWGT